MNCWRGHSINNSCFTSFLATRPYVRLPSRGIAATTRWRMSTTHEERTALELRQARLHQVYVDKITLVNDDVRLIRLAIADSQSLEQVFVFHLSS